MAFGYYGIMIFRLQFTNQVGFLFFSIVDPKDCTNPWGLVAVYGDPTRVRCREIWKEIDNFVELMNGKACLVGDFNAVSSLNEKMGGSASLGTPNREFRDWISNSGYLDLGYHGPAYMWTNGQGGSTNISQRLDKALATVQWTISHLDIAVFHLPKFSSDHLPILLRTKPK